MKDGSAQDHTSIKFEVSEFNTTLDYLTEHFNVLQSHKDSGEIMIKAQKDYKQLLKSLAQKIYILSILKQEKVRFVIRTLILIKEVTNK